MNANLDKEQIEYIQSIVGDLQYWDRAEEDEGFWRDIIIEEGEFILKRDEDERRHYAIHNDTYQLGDRYFEVMGITNYNEMQNYSDIIDHYGDWSYDVTEVYPREIVTIDYR